MKQKAELLEPPGLDQLRAFMDTLGRELDDAYRVVPELRDFAKTSSSETINWLLDTALNDPGFVPNMRTATTLMLHKSSFCALFFAVLGGMDDYRLRVLRESTENRVLHSTPGHHVLVVAGPRPTRVHLYRSSRVCNFSLLDRENVLINLGTRCLSPFEAIVLEAGRDVIALRDQDPTVIFRISFAEQHSIRWDYDSESLAPVRAVSNDLSESRLPFACQVLAELGDLSSIGTLADIAANHPTHFVRWGALRAIVQLSPEAAQHHLQRARHDGHEHVRYAARETLKLVQAWLRDPKDKVD